MRSSFLVDAILAFCVGILVGVAQDHLKRRSDHWYMNGAQVSHDDFLRNIGLNPNAPYVIN